MKHRNSENMIENIGKIRKDVKEEIKEKIKNNTQYLNPMSKEFQDECKRLGLTGNQLIQKYKEKKWYKELEQKYGEEFANWAKQNKYKVPNCVISAGCKNWKEYHNRNAKDMGFENNTDYARQWRNHTGRHLPISENIECNRHFGEFIAENYIIKTFEDPVRMPPNWPSYDWICKNGQKIQCEARCLCINNSSIGWDYWIDYNNIADYFILSAWNNREDLEPLYIWIFHKNDIIRGNKFWRRNGLWITNKPHNLRELAKYEVKDKLEKLKEYCNKARH